MRAANDSLPPLFLSDDPRAVARATADVPALSSGHVRKPEGLNRRTGKPEREGIFCARIFGPVEDHRCLCGKLSTPDSAGQVCDRCGVLCGEQRLRGERWGHIESPVPLVHPRLAPQIAAALGCSTSSLKSVLAFKADLRDDGSVVTVDHGDGGGLWRVAERLGTRTSELMLTHVPVTPPAWRGTRNDPQDSAYMRLINRCNRLRRLIELDAPRIILNNEAFMTQQAFERLLQAVRAELRVRGPVVVAPVTPRSAELLQAVYDDPDDDDARRAYARHLTAAGDPRGDFITRQLASAACSRTPRVEADLLRRNLERWLAPLGDAVEPGAVFRRGFIAACKTIARGAEPRIGDPAWATVEHLDTDLADLIAHPVMRALRSLAVPYTTLRRLCEGEVVLPRIDTLLVRLSRSPPPKPEPVTRCEALPGLRVLTLVCRAAKAPDFAWLGDTRLVSQLERLTVVLSLEALDSLALPWWLSLMQRHPLLTRITLDLGPRHLLFELQRDDLAPALRVVTSHALLERIMMGYAEPAESLARLLTALDPGDLSSLRVDSRVTWFSEELIALARALQNHFGAHVRLPSVAWV